MITLEQPTSTDRQTEGHGAFWYSTPKLGKPVKPRHTSFASCLRTSLRHSAPPSALSSFDYNHITKHSPYLGVPDSLLAPCVLYISGPSNRSFASCLRTSLRHSAPPSALSSFDYNHITKHSPYLGVPDSLLAPCVLYISGPSNRSFASCLRTSLRHSVPP